MKVESIYIHNVGGVSSLRLEKIHSQLNIICGENGVGKTNILDSIASCFSEFDKNNLKKKAGSNKGEIDIIVNDNKTFHIELDEFEPSEFDTYMNNYNYDNNKNHLLYLKINRNINYRKIQSINSDPDITNRARENTSGIQNEDIKDWLLNRILHSKHERHLTKIQLDNLELAKKCFGFLNSSFEYSRLNTKNEIFLNTPTGEIYFEYLSSGFKSTIFILLGIIKEIDYRLENNRIFAKDYDGLILIDEIELHLHPEWQGRICAILKKTFPKAQFFISTHSPHVVQTAMKGEVIALERENNGAIYQRELPVSEYGYQGWTIEEILEDIMGMPDLRTIKYNEEKKKFDKALEDRNKLDAQEAYNELDKMLHPQYPLRIVFRMQLDSVLGE